MEEPMKARLLVNGRGIEIFVDILSKRAEQGDQEAEDALVKLRDALDSASKLCNEGPELTEDQYVAIHDGLLILKEAQEGRSEYSLNELRAIGRQVAEDCRKLGLGPLDISFLDEDF